MSLFEYLNTESKQHSIRRLGKKKGKYLQSTTRRVTEEINSLISQLSNQVENNTTISYVPDNIQRKTQERVHKATLLEKGGIALSKSQRGLARWGAQTQSEGMSSPPLYTAQFDIEADLGLNTGYYILTEGVLENNPIFEQNPLVPHLRISPGTYWLVPWGVVDQDFGKEKQGFGSDRPESYLSNARSVEEWTARLSATEIKQRRQFRKMKEKGNKSSDRVKSTSFYEKVMQFFTRKQENGNSGTELGGKRNSGETTKERTTTDEEASGSDLPHEKDRIVKGRKYWPADPVVLIVSTEGVVSVDSHVLHCAWWNRGEREGLGLGLGGRHRDGSGS